jgi:membrane-bound lytic murein transglycosylase B
MPRRRLYLIGALVVVLVPLAAFAVTRLFLTSDAGEPVAAKLAPTTTTSSEAATTTAAPGSTSTTASTAATASTTSTITSDGSLPKVPRPGEPVAAADDAGLASQIRVAEAAIADPATPAADLARQGHIQQVAYRALVNQPQRLEAVIGFLDPALRPVVQDNVSAGAKLRAMIKEPKTALPPWRVVAPAPADELLADYHAAESEIGVPWQYLAAINLVETRMGRIRGNSDAGAQGPMQFLPATFAQYGNGGDIQSNHDSIFAAARLLKHNGAPGDIRNAIYNYNHDQRYVDAVLLYAGRMASSPRAFYGYHRWQVYYVTTAGDVWLPEGYVGPNGGG